MGSKSFYRQTLPKDFTWLFLPYRPWVKWGNVLETWPGTYAGCGRFHRAIKIFGDEYVTVQSPMDIRFDEKLDPQVRTPSTLIMASLQTTMKPVCLLEFAFCYGHRQWQRTRIWLPSLYNAPHHRDAVWV